MAIFFTAFSLINTVGFFKHYTNNFWTKSLKSNKELIISDCEYIYKEVNDIHHYVKALKIKVNEHLPCRQRVTFIYSLK